MRQDKVDHCSEETILFGGPAEDFSELRIKRGVMHWRPRLARQVSGYFVIQKMIIRILRRAPRYLITAMTLIGIYLLSMNVFQSYSRLSVEHEAERDDVLLTSPFVKDQPKLVILLSYQRSGSSFVGEWFNTNPDVFYNFEPVDSLYSAMYGTPQNSNVPSDITNYPNGSARILPAAELNAVSNYLQKFLHCELDSLPTQSLMNFYFISSHKMFKAVANYTGCLRNSFVRTFRQCEPHVTRFCGSRFGVAPEANQKECFQRIWLKKEVKSTNPVNGTMVLRFSKHQSCLKRQGILVKTNCQRLLLNTCRTHPIRVIKTVRATMESMEPLLKRHPNFRVIHLVRDPRAVALSRKLFGGQVRGIYAGNDTNTIAKEAKLYCSTVVRDIKTRKKLEREYPGKIYAMLYDELITNPMLYLERVYEFLDTKPSHSVVDWLSTHGKMNSKTNMTSEEIARHWKTVITVQVNEEIVDSCREFFQLTRQKWAL